MTQGEVMGLTTVIGTALSLLGITGIDSGMLNGAVQGVISLITLGAAIWSWRVHKQNAQ